jgi:hypothetical protein
VNCRPIDKILFPIENPISYLNLHNENDILPFYELPNLKTSTRINLEEYLEEGKFFQGDIVLMDDQKEIFEFNGRHNDGIVKSLQTGILNESYRWPKDMKGYVIVPYRIAEYFGEKVTFFWIFFSYRSILASNQVEEIMFAMRYLQAYTCIRFVKMSNEYDFINIISGKGCYSNLGKTGGPQDVSLQRNGCLVRGIIMHELIHALGYGKPTLLLKFVLINLKLFLDHMHNHADRDKYIEIRWQNIQDDSIHNFEKDDDRDFGNFGTNYDYRSVMHYEPRAFSKNGHETIVPRNSFFKNIIGQREYLSYGDAKRINNMYKCFQ